MTFKEKLAQEHPEYISDIYLGGAKGCPYKYGYIDENDCTLRGLCSICWNREMPEPDGISCPNANGAEGVPGAIKDSGERREFATGAVRDIEEGKGRFDLVPLEVLAKFNGDDVIECIAEYRNDNDISHLYIALSKFACSAYGDFKHGIYSMFLEVAKHFEEGAKKYGENNWQKGLPVNCYIDSAVRHYLKFKRGDQDEPHDRAFVWNLMCCIWEIEFSPRAEEAKTKKPITVTYTAGVEITDTMEPSEEIHFDSPEYRKMVAQNIKETLHIDNVVVNWVKTFVHD